MSPVRERLFGYQHAFDHPVVAWIAIGVAALLVVCPLIVWLLQRAGKVNETLSKELHTRIRSWAILAPLIIGPILLGAAWTILAVTVLCVLCYREYARVTGLFRQKIISLFVVIGILGVSFATLDHWYGFFVALGPLTVVVIAAVGILPDQPKGYVQRAALGVFGFILFGVCLGHLGYFANDANYRAMLLLIIASVELNDVFAFTAGKTLGRHKLCPNTSPNKTIEGAAGALVLTTAFVAGVGHFAFRGGVMDQPVQLIVLGVLISVAGQLGDLMLSAIKRDVGIKDTGAAIPGHGGLLDRFDSLLLVAPAVFHFVGYFQGIGLDEPKRIITGGP